MDFPITNEKLLAYAQKCAESLDDELREALIDCLDLVRTDILVNLETQVAESIYARNKKTTFSVYAGNIGNVLNKFHHDDVLRVLKNVFLIPFLTEHFPCADYVLLNTEVYIRFTLPSISNQTSNP